MWCVAQPEAFMETISYIVCFEVPSTFTLFIFFNCTGESLRFTVVKNLGSFRKRLRITSVEQIRGQHRLKYAVRNGNSLNVKKHSGHACIYEES